MDALELLFRLLEIGFKAAVKFTQNVLPRDLALLDGVELLFHAGRELRVHDVGEFILHQLRHDAAERRDAQEFALLDDILTVDDGRDRGRVGRGSADAVLLKRADERRVGVARGGLGEVLLLVEALQLQRLPLGQRRQRGGLFLLVIVAGFLIHGGVAGELQAARARAEFMHARGDLDGDAVIDGVRHLAGEEAAPDEPVEAVLLARKVALEALGREVHVGGTDGLVRVLRAGLGLEAAGRGGIIVLAVAAEDESLRGGERLLADAQRVGTHIGDQAHGALAGDVHALVELLGDRHGAARGHVELAAGLLLERGGGERRGGRALLVRALDALDREHRALRVGDDRVDLLAGGGLELLAVFAVIVRGEGLMARLVEELRVERPVFLGLEALDLLFALVHHARGDGLHTARGKTAAHLLPKERGQLVAHDAVEHAARLLRVHEVLVDLARARDALLHDVLRDLVEGHAPGLLIVQVEQILEMPRDGFALAVRVRREIDGVALLRGLLQLADQGLLAADGLIIGLEIVLDVDAQLALGQVAQMAHAGLDRVAPAEIFPDGFRLGRRLDDHQIFFCHVFDSFIPLVPPEWKSACRRSGPHSRRARAW